jgi:hypothetical protein
LCSIWSNDFTPAADLFGWTVWIIQL